MLISDFLTYTTYKGETVVDVFTKINIPDELSALQFYDEYIIQENDRWDRVSNNAYGNPHLWWLIAAYNNFADPFIVLVPGNKLNIIKPELIPNLLLSMKGYIK